MMRISLLFCICAAFGCLSFSYFRDDRSGVEQCSLRGPVSHIRYVSYIVTTINDTIVKTRRYMPWSGELEKEIWFDRQGNILRVEHRDSNDVVRDSVLYFYDHLHRVVLTRHSYTDSTCHTIEYTYDSLARFIEKRSLYTNTRSGSRMLDDWTRYSFDSLGREWRVMHVDSFSDKRSYTGELVYGRDGLVVQENYKGGRGDYFYSYRYDARGNMIEKFEQYAVAHKSTRSEYTYTGNRLTTARYFTDEKFVYKYEYMYTPNGVLTTEYYYYLDEATPNLITHYDSLGNFTAFVHYSNGFLTETTHYQHTYDSHGNWTKRVEYRDGKAVKVEEREIAYY